MEEQIMQVMHHALRIQDAMDDIDDEVTVLVKHKRITIGVGSDEMLRTFAKDLRMSVKAMEGNILWFEPMPDVLVVSKRYLNAR